MSNRVGQKLGNYRLMQPLGRGGFAEVYLGEHIYLRTYAALKVLSTYLAQEDTTSFLSEARTLSSLKHPHIVRLLDFGMEDATPFLVMEYAVNGTLRQRHPKGSRHPERIAGVIGLSTLTRVQAKGWFKVALLTLPLVRHFMKWFYPLAPLNFNDPKVQAEVLKQASIRDPHVTIDFTDPQAIAYIKQQVRIPLAAIDELVHLTRQERHSLKKVTSPLLLIHSKRDQTVPPACAEEAYRLATHAEPKSLHWLEQSDHVITVGSEREEVYQPVNTFISTTIRAAAKTVPPADVQQVAEDGSPLDR